MQYIEKGQEPSGLKHYKETPGVCFLHLPSEVKTELKESLLREQGYICCYCGKRIELDPSTKLEHLLCRAQHPDLELVYENIIASCDGSQGEHDRKRFPIHCDAKKRNKMIDISPLCQDCEDRFWYDEDGGIYGGSDTVQKVIDTLGLDCATVKNRRKAAIKAYTIYRDFPELTEETPDFWRIKLEYNLTRDSEGKYPEYCFAVRYYIRGHCLQPIE